MLGADPLVEYQPAKGEKPEVPGGIGEEDIVYLVLPYIRSAREGVLRLGKLLEAYGTYEMNGIAFQDVNEIWWLETIGGHHWMARRVPDDVYVVMPNQLGIDAFDLDDAFGAQENHLCSADLREFIAKNHLDLSLDGALNPGTPLAATMTPTTFTIPPAHGICCATSTPAHGCGRVPMLTTPPCPMTCRGAWCRSAR